jgi:hypothetical protein
MTAAGVLLWLAISVEAPPRPYPFAPFADPDSAATAARLERRLAAASGTRAALRVLCGRPPPPPAQRDEREAVSRYYDSKAIEKRVAQNFLIAHADDAFPLLLDAIGRGDRSRASEAAATCGYEAFSLVREGICEGFEAGGSSEELEAQPLARERRALSQRALAAALAAGGSRAAVALDLLAEDTGLCAGLPQAVHAATPTLVKLLGVPLPPVRIPVHPHDTRASSWDVAFRVLSFQGADRALAEQPVAAFLEHDASAPLAALAIARMGGDATSAVPRIARVLEAIQVTQPAQLTQLGDAVDALVAIGQPARAALPSLARLLSRADMPGCHSLGEGQFARAVHAIATPADAVLEQAALAPLARCPR